MDDRTTNLQRALKAHRPHDGDEAGHREATLALLGAGADPFDRAHFDPGHVTASGFVLDPASGVLLLIRHRRLDRWLQPGGHVEPDDRDAESAARREVLEETGLELGTETPAVLFDLDVHMIPAGSREPEHRHFDVRYLFLVPRRPAVAGDGVREARWFPLDALKRLDDSPGRARLSAKLRLKTVDRTHPEERR